MKENMELDEAVNLILDHTLRNEVESVDILKSFKCILAESISSEFNVPSFDKSPLDGFALIAEDTVSATEESPVKLKVKETIPAGTVPEKTLFRGEASRIMTGAKIPKGANAVVRLEDTECDEKDVYVKYKLTPQSNIISEGEDMKKGDIILNSGIQINEGEIGILSAVGKREVKVYRKPKVGIIATGSELVSKGDALPDGKTYDVNTFTLSSKARNLNCEIKSFGICSDNVLEISDAIKKALEWSDLLVTTGGVSAGDLDLMKESLDFIGADTLFWKVNIKPGTPALVAKYDNKLIFALSGNPAASYITFEKLAKPSILKKSGFSKVFNSKVESIMKSSFNKKSNQNRIIRAKTYYSKGKFYTEIPDKHSSGVVSSLSGINSLLFVKANQKPLCEGESVVVELMGEMEVR